MSTSAAAKQSLGAKSHRHIADYLREIGDDEAAERFEGRSGTGQSLPSFFGTDVWAYTGMLIGFIPPGGAADPSEIKNAMGLAADVSLKGTRIKVSLDRFWVQDYPGLGTHTILCEFTGKNQIQGEAEEMRFAITTSARDKSAASVNGSPIFLGVSVGKNGIAFEGRTVNVRSDADELLLSALGSGPFRDGLALLTTAQPALIPFVGLAGSVVNSVMKRQRNRQVFHFKLGLDFAGSASGAGLRLGSYVIVQGSDVAWTWDQYVWRPDAQQVVRKADGAPIDFNYLVVRVSPYE